MAEWVVLVVGACYNGSRCNVTITRRISNSRFWSGRRRRWRPATQVLAFVRAFNAFLGTRSTWLHARAACLLCLHFKVVRTILQVNRQTWRPNVPYRRRMRGLSWKPYALGGRRRRDAVSRPGKWSALQLHLAQVERERPKRRRDWLRSKNRTSDGRQGLS